MFASLNWRLWAFIGNAAVIAALIIALLFTRSTLADEKHERVMAEAKLSVSNSSIRMLETEIKRMRKETLDLASNDAIRMQESRQAIQMAEAVAKVRRAAITRLEQSAADMMIEPVTPVSNTCQASPTLLNEWK